MKNLLLALLLMSSTPAFAWFGDGFPPSGVPPVTGTFTGIGASAIFAPKAGRTFNYFVQGTFVANIQLEYSFDGGTTWVLGQYDTYTAPDIEYQEMDEVGVLIRWECTSYTSGTITYRISQ